MEPLMIGVLLDVSGSMQNASTEGADTGDGEWARSIFTVIDNLIKHDLKPDNHIFAIGFGGSCDADPNVFDLLGSLEKEDPVKPLDDVLYEIVRILKISGAHNVDKWAPMSTLMSALRGQENNCNRVLKQLQRDDDFVRYVVDYCLPSECRDFKGNDLVSNVLNVIYSGACSAVTQLRIATKQEIDEVVEKIKQRIGFLNMLKAVSDKSIFNVHAAHRIIKGHVGNENDLTKKRIDELMDKVRPYIYGGTPLYEALGKAAEMLGKRQFHDHKKLLFILSDGKPTDGPGNITAIRGNITTVCCYITSSRLIDPYVLYSSATNTQSWEHGAQFMFTTSSEMLTKNVPRTIFVKRKWTVEMINNETQLFLEVNHPDHLKDACDFAREVVTSQEALSDVLASVDLDIYINQNVSQFSAQEQVGPTCYANASAAVMHLAMHRILGRDGGHPNFGSLRDEMISCYSKQPGGEQGADTEVVLQEICPRYRLRCKKVNKKDTIVAIMEKRPVVARFRLTQKEWSNFGRFFAYDPIGILTSQDIGTRERNEKTTGHAVVLTSFNSKCLRFMNSWGTGWGDDGFFNVKDADVLGFEFYDIYWDEADLTPQENAHYATHGSEVANKLMENLTGLQESTFQCPLCKTTSKVTEFKGRLSSVTCPKCRKPFSCGTKGNILALNLYLTSISYKQNDTAENRNVSTDAGAYDSTRPNPNECKQS